MPVYLLFGDEDFNIELRVKELKKNILKNESNPLNYKKYDNPPFKVFDEILRTQGMMFGEVLYVIKANKYFLNDSKKIDFSDREIEEIIKSIEFLSANIHIVLVCEIPKGERKKPDSRRKLYKAIEKYGKIEQFEAYKAWEDYKIAPWIKNNAKLKNIEIKQNAISKLIEISGTSLRNLDNQLEKLKLLAHPDNSITLDMVEKICTDTNNLYLISDLILKRDFTKALREIAKLFEVQHPLLVLSFLQTAFSNILKTKLYSEKMTSGEIARLLNQHEFIVRKNIEKLSSVELSELIRIKQNLTEAEFKIKTGTITDPLIAFELALFGKYEGAKCLMTY